MNKKEALRLLSENLEKYLKDGFFFHTKFLEEFKELVKKCQGHENEIFSLLIKQLNYIKVLGKDVHNVSGNEILRHLNRDYYSLHLNSKNFNIRLLMTFDEDNNPVFLVAFYERQGKRKTDYTQAKGVLEERFNSRK